MSSKKKAAAKASKAAKEADADAKLLAEGADQPNQEKKEDDKKSAAKPAASAVATPAPVAAAAKPSPPIVKSPAVAKANPNAVEAKPAAAEGKPAGEAKPAASVAPKPAAPGKPAAAATAAPPATAPAVATAADQDDKPLTEEERLKKRAERFGIVTPSPSDTSTINKLAARQKRFGNMTLDNRPNKRQSGDITPELEAKIALSARLGLPVKGTKLATDIESMGKNIAEADEKLKMRSARFGTTDPAVATNPEEEEKKRRRMERFAKQ